MFVSAYVCTYVCIIHTYVRRYSMYIYTYCLCIYIRTYILFMYVCIKLICMHMYVRVCVYFIVPSSSGHALLQDDDTVTGNNIRFKI